MHNDDFFFKTPNRRAEEFAGAGVGINISGQDWLGLGEIFGSMAQGTATCGAKPVCWSTSKDDNCAKKMEAFNQCNLGAVNLMEQQLRAQEKFEENKNTADKRKRNTMIAVISLVSVAVIVITILILRKRKA